MRTGSDHDAVSSSPGYAASRWFMPSGSSGGSFWDARQTGEIVAELNVVAEDPNKSPEEKLEWFKERLRRMQQA